MAIKMDPAERWINFVESVRSGKRFLHYSDDIERQKLLERLTNGAYLTNELQFYSSRCAGDLADVGDAPKYLQSLYPQAITGVDFD